MRDSLLQYWPSSENVAACIRAEAETVDEAVFLAVHQPLRFTCKVVGATAADTTYSENDLLATFMVERPPEGRVIMPIVGKSGVGKSHLIRWFDAQLRRHRRANSLHIIRIPKGSSLKRVLRLILDGLEGPAYDKLRGALSQAHEQLHPELAAKLLLTYLLHHVLEASRQASTRLVSGVSTDPTHDKAVRDYGAMLQRILGDPTVTDMLLERDGERPGVIALLAEHVTVEGGREVDERRHQFRAEDLLVPNDLVAGMNAAARNAYLNYLSHSEENRKKAADLLNSMLDAAKQDLLRLGDGSLTDLFVDVRANLFRDGKELVLLVEDFAVLSGLQKALLDVMIREAYRDGRQELCTIRSALAYTDDYLLVDTVRTRAKSEWHITESDAVGTLIERAVDLVGGYLNAARIGVEALRSAFADRRDDDFAGWRPAFNADAGDDAETLEAFGRSSAGYALFPFNRACIEQLVINGSRDTKGQPVFNPRSIINNVLHMVLRRREDFARGQFLAGSFGGDTELRPRVADLVDRQAKSIGQGPASARYRRLAAYWGGAGLDEDALRNLPSAIYTAFGLIPLFDVVKVAPPRERRVAPVAPPRSGEVQSPEPPPAWKVQLEDLEQKLLAWHRGANLPAKDLAELRKLLVKGMESYVAWDEWLAESTWAKEHLFEQIYFPGSGGTLQPQDSCLIVCTDAQRRDEDASTFVRNALLAAARRDWGGDGWDYDGGERDASIYAEFMLPRVPRFVEFVRGRPFYVAGDPVPGLTEGLLVTARCLGVQFPAAPDDTDFVRILFADVQRSASPGATAIDLSSWDSATTAAASWRATAGLSPREALLTQVGVGRGASAVVDVVRLRPIFDALRKSWRVGSPIPSSEATRARPIRNLSNGLGQFQSALDAALRISTKRLPEWRQRVQDALGENFDKAAIVPIFDAAITAIGDSGLAVGSDLPALRRMLKKFTEYPVKTAYDDIRRIENERAPGFVLDLLAHLDRAMLENVTAFFGAMDSAFEQVDRAAKGQAVVTGTDPVADARGALVQTLDDINALLGEIEGEVQ